MNIYTYLTMYVWQSASIVYQKLDDEDDEDSYLNSRWADPNALSTVYLTLAGDLSRL